jgi:hypothetical protein
MMFLGARRIVKRNTDEKVYKEYFGENYTFTFDDNYSLLISNHTGWIVRKIIIYFFLLFFNIKFFKIFFLLNFY